MSAGATERSDEGHGPRNRRRVFPHWFATFLGTPSGIIGALGLLLLLTLAFFPESIGGDPLIQTARPLEAPTMAHIFGTDELGRDLFARVVGGARGALWVAIGSASLAALIGVPLGLLAGYRGGWLDQMIMRFFDVVLGVPTIVVALLVVAVMGIGTVNVILAVASAMVPIFGRLARASTLGTKGLDYVVAARAMGATDRDIMFRTILSKITGPLIVQFIVAAALAVTIAASLSFIGLGEAPPAPSWGRMLSEARSYLGISPLYGVFPGLALAFTIATFDSLGRAVRKLYGIGRPSVQSQGAE